MNTDKTKLCVLLIRVHRCSSVAKFSSCKKSPGTPSNGLTNGFRAISSCKKSPGTPSNGLTNGFIAHEPRRKGTPLPRIIGREQGPARTLVLRLSELGPGCGGPLPGDYDQRLEQPAGVSWGGKSQHVALSHCGEYGTAVSQEVETWRSAGRPAGRPPRSPTEPGGPGAPVRAAKGHLKPARPGSAHRYPAAGRAHLPGNRGYHGNHHQLRGSEDLPDQTGDRAVNE